MTEVKNKRIEDLVDEIILLLKKCPKLKTRSSRDAWILSLPSSIMEDAERSDAIQNDLAFILHPLQTLQLDDKQWAILKLLDAVLPNMKVLLEGKRYEQLRNQIEENLNASLLEGGSENSIPTLKPRDDTPLQISTRTRWIRDLGFKMDPFEYVSGANDPNLLQYFHPIPNFYEILGHPSKLDPVFIFGAEGSGRSSLRNAIAQMCWHDSILPVIFDSFDSIALISQRRSVRSGDYINEIIRLMLSALSGRGDIQPVLAKDSDPHNVELRNLLWQYANKYVSHNLERQRLLAILDPNLSPSPVSMSVHGSLETLKLLIEVTCKLFCFKAVYVLIDPSLINPPVSEQKMMDILRPLLETPALLDLNKCKGAVKFFLDYSFKEMVESIPYILSKYGGMFHTISWKRSDLRKLLHERIMRSSSGKWVSLGQISEESQLDDIMVRHSMGSPRQLISLCNRLFAAHNYDESQRLITKTEIDQVLAEFANGPREDEIVKIISSEDSRIVNPYILQQIIWQGENLHVEFKSTLRFNLNTGGSDSKLELTIAKEICGFSNTSGGLLIVGVGDKSEAIGLEFDFGTLSVGKRNEDGFRLLLTDIYKNYLNRFHEMISVQFNNYEDKKVCIIIVPKSTAPLYCKVDNRYEFFVRVDNSARRLDTPDAFDWIRRNFPNF